MKNLSKSLRSIFFLVDGRPAKISSDGGRTLIASLVSIVGGFLIGELIILIIGFSSGSTPKNIGAAAELVLLGLFNTGNASGVSLGFNPTNIGNMLFRATPIILTGLSVAVAFKTGLFNIGAPGQYLMGASATLLIALGVPSSVVAPEIIWLLAFVGGMLAGAVWGAIPGLLKAYLNINEVIACIMTNWIAAAVATWIFDGSDFRNMDLGGGSKLYKTSSNNVCTSRMGLDDLFPGSQADAGIFIAILFAIAVYIILYKTVFGFELKACGANRHAAQYAGIKSRRSIVLSMAIAGALAAAAASLYYLNYNTEFDWNTYQSLPAEGFNGIPVALLAANNPIAVIFSGCFMSMLNINGLQIKNFTVGYNEYITDIIIAVIVYFSAFSLFIRNMLAERSRKKAEKHIASSKQEWR